MTEITANLSWKMSNFCTKNMSKINTNVANLKQKTKQ